MKKVIIILTVLLISTSCEQHRAMKVRKWAAMYGWNQEVPRDALEAEVNYMKPKTELKIKIEKSGLQLPDTSYWEKDDAKLTRIETEDSIFYSVICDTLTVTDTIRIEQDPCPPVIGTPIEVEKPLSKLDNYFLTAGKISTGIIGVLIILFIIRLVAKIKGGGLV